MGIATGEAELRGEDYFGPALNRAARVMAAGHGGQILVAAPPRCSSTARPRRPGPAPAARIWPQPVGCSRFGPTGSAPIPGVAYARRLAGNLRPAATSFIGREAELATVTAALRAHRFVTLTGVGGVGKTRLALEVAAGLAGEFPDGVWVFELAAVGDPGGSTRCGGDRARHHPAARHDTHREHRCRRWRAESACWYSTTASTSSTPPPTWSRNPCRDRNGQGAGHQPRGHRTCRRTVVAGALAGRGGRIEVGGGSAVRRTRTQRRTACLVGGADETKLSSKSAERLDGIPLAIELAASRMASMTIGDIRDRLDQRFRLLVGSRRGLERHQTLRHAVAVVLRLLDDAGRRYSTAVRYLRAASIL